MTNSTTLSAATAAATISAYQQLQSDLATIPNQDLSNANSQQLAIIQNDIKQYYSVQSGERGYAAMAANVVANSDYNGNVANANLAAGLVEQGYSGAALVQKTIKIEVDLAQADYATMTRFVSGGATNQPDYLYIPTISQIDQAHIIVYLSNGISPIFWGGFSAAYNNIVWIANPTPAEVADANMQSVVFNGYSDADAKFAANNLVWAGILNIFKSNLDGSATFGLFVPGITPVVVLNSPSEVFSDLILALKIISSTYGKFNPQELPSTVPPGFVAYPTAMLGEFEMAVNPEAVANGVNVSSAGIGADANGNPLWLLSLSDGSTIQTAISAANDAVNCVIDILNAASQLVKSITSDISSSGSKTVTTNQDGSSVTLYQNGLGELISRDQENVDGTSQNTIYNADGSSTTTSYTSAYETGTVVKIDQENANGTSQITTFAPDGSAIVNGFSGPSGSGVETAYFNSSTIEGVTSSGIHLKQETYFSGTNDGTGKWTNTSWEFFYTNGALTDVYGWYGYSYQQPSPGGSTAFYIWHSTEGVYIDNRAALDTTGSLYTPDLSHENQIFNITDSTGSVNLGSNNDIINYQATSGNVTVNLGSGTPILNLGQGIISDEVVLSADTHGDLAIDVAGSGVIDVVGDLSVGGNGQIFSALPEITLASGAVIQLGTSNDGSQMTLQETAGGGAVLNASNWGNNAITLTAGGSSVFGGKYANSYLFQSGAGQVNLTLGGSTSLKFGPGIARSSIVASANSAGDLTLSVAGTSDSVTLIAALSLASGALVSAVPSVGFDDGSTLMITSSIINNIQNVGGGATVAGIPYGNDTFQFMPGGGEAIGGSGRNTYEFGLGDGSSVIMPGSGANSVQMGTGISASQLSFSSDVAGDEIISIVGTTDSLEILGDLSVSGSKLNSAVASIGFADGSSMPIGTSIHYAYAVSGGQQVQGSAFGQNVFNFGPGGGTAIGNGFGNTFNFSLGDGACTITNPGSAVLNFGAGIMSSMLSFASNPAGDLTISVNGSSDSLTIQGEFSLSGSAVKSMIPQISFSDGSVLALGSNLLYLHTVSGGATVVGSLFGQNAFVFGAGGGCAIGGGFGNSYSYLHGDGAASITLGTASDTLSLGAGITASMLTYSANSAGDLMITIGGNGDAITIKKDLTSSGTALVSELSRITFSDGSYTSLNSGMKFSQSVGGGSTVVGSSTGNNVFQFGPGGGTAVGGTGSNTYLFGIGDGVSVIAGPTNGAIDFAPGLTAANLSYTADAAGDLTISVVGTSDSLTIDHELSLNAAGTSTTAAIPYVLLSTGAQIYLGQTLSYNHTVGGGSVVAATPYGQNVFQFGSGGGTANGGTFTNTYLFGAGDGSCVIANPSNGIIKLAAGISASNLSYTTDAVGDLTISVAGTSDSLTINHELSLNSAGTSVNGAITYFSLSNGSQINLNQTLSYNHTVGGGASVSATPYGQNVFQFAPGGGTAVGGTFTNNYLFGLGDGASVISNPTNGIITFGSGILASNLVFTADSAGDLTIGVVGTSDSLTIDRELALNSAGTSVNGAITYLSLSNGSQINLNQTLSYNHTVGGGAVVNATVYGQNVFQFAPGGGTAVGGTFTSTYLFGLGDGSSVISSPTNGIVKFGAGIAASNLSYTADAAGDLTISVAGTSDSLTINHELSLNSAGTSVNGAINYLSLSNGSQINLNQTLSFNHTVGGGSTVAATAYGQNVFQFASGGGTAQGGNFTNTYLFGRGDGACIITNPAHGLVTFGPGIVASNLSFSADASGDLTVNIVGTSDSLTIDNELSISGSTVTGAIASFNFSNGSSLPVNSSLTFSEIVPAGSVVTGSQFGNNSMQFQLGGGTAIGGRFANTFIFNEGDGLANITPTSLGTIDLGAGINSSDLWLSRSGNNLLLTVMDGQNDQISVTNWFTNSPQTLQAIVGSDGHKIDTAIGTLETAMANYQASNPGFSPIGSTSMPVNTTLQNSINSAWHT